MFLDALSGLICRPASRDDADGIRRDYRALPERRAGINALGDHPGEQDAEAWKQEPAAHAGDPDQELPALVQPRPDGPDSGY